MARKSRRFALAALVVVGAGLGVASPLQGANGAAVSGDCTVADATSLDAAALAANNGRAPADGYEHRKWVASPERQKAKDVFDKRIQERFGSVDEKTGRQERLERGLVGITLDHRAQQIVVVTDPAADLDEAKFASELRGLNSEYRRNNPGSSELGVRVQEGCHSAADLLEAFNVLKDRSWHPRADEIAYGASLFASDSTYHVSLPTDAREVGDALKAKLGSVVTINYTETGPQGTACPSGDTTSKTRAHDCQPHTGGSAIAVNGNDTPTCTMGFTVNTASAGQAMVTAGHCFGVGRTGDVVMTDTHEHVVGTVTHNLFDDYDMAIVNHATNDYDDRVYNTPYSYDIDVSGDANPEEGDTICVGDKNSSGSTCEMDVIDLNSINSYTVGGVVHTLNWTLMHLEYPAGLNPCPPGSSGGPYYTRVGTNSSAIINGMQVARDPGVYACYGHRITSIEDRLAVDVATTG